MPPGGGGGQKVSTVCKESSDILCRGSAWPHSRLVFDWQCWSTLFGHGVGGSQPQIQALDWFSFCAFSQIRQEQNKSEVRISGSAFKGFWLKTPDDRWKSCQHVHHNFTNAAFTLSEKSRSCKIKFKIQQLSVTARERERERERERSNISAITRITGGATISVEFRQQNTMIHP